ncbi:ribosomal RNA small subunit methyltransferase A [Patescibacteria group bacterium]|nr:ribosomal RNA small subunit methyltransferase A [Patescibacteria group bacterium]
MEKIVAKKSLGQNFLKSSTILDKIISAADVQEGDIILEVGPGKGALTEKLLEKAKLVVAVEKDDRLIYFLKEKFAEEIKQGKFTLIRGDILNFDPNSPTNELKTELLRGETPKDFDGYKVVANIPYYITGKLIRNFLSSNFQPSQMIIMVQKEVANRIVGEKDVKKQKENILSLSVKVYGEPKFIKTIPARYFSPQPKVDSAILRIDNISKYFFKNINEEKFFNLIHQAFSSKRKVLVNNLSNISSKEELISTLEKLNIPLKTRAEDLSVENWKNLYQELKI